MSRSGRPSSYFWGSLDQPRALPYTGEMRWRTWLRRAFRTLNVLLGAVMLASALAVLASHFFEAGYAEVHRDAVWFVVPYAAFAALCIVVFARDHWLAPWLAIAKALGAYFFLVTFVRIGPLWMVWTPGRYVYQLFDWGEASKAGLFAFAFLGRGAWNTINATYFTAPWWGALRVRAPLVGRLVTAIPTALVVFCAWAFLQLVTFEAQTFSAEAYQVAQLVLDNLDCDMVRTRGGTETTDLRQLADRKYEVRISYDCRYTRVIVRGEDGRRGTAGAPRAECCAAAS